MILIDAINFRGESVEAVSLQVKETLKGTTLTRSKVIECCKAIFDAQDWEASPLKFYPKKIVKLLFSKDGDDAALEFFAEKVWERVRVVPGDSIDRLPSEVLQIVLKQGTAATLGSILQIGTYLHKEAQIVIADRIREASAIVFGAAEWKEFMGAEVGQEPALPANIFEILAEACPFSRNGRTVAETHLLTLIPKTINGQPLNLNTLGKLFKAKFPNVGNDTGYRFIWGETQDAAVNHGKSSWVLITRDVVKESKGKTYKEQQDLLASRGQNKYKVPHSLEAAACILLEYARSKGQTRLYSDSPRTYTRCREKSIGFQSYIGGFARNGLYIGEGPSEDQVNIGIAAFRKFA